MLYSTILLIFAIGICDDHSFKGWAKLAILLNKYLKINLININIIYILIINIILTKKRNLIRPHYPAFSFGTSKRFKSIEVDGRNSENKKIKINQRNNTDRNDINDNWCKSLYFYGSQDFQSFLKTQTMMGTGKKMVVKDNGFPAPNRYIIRGFADDIKRNGDKVNATRMVLKEKKTLEDIEKINMAKLREERYEEKRRALKMSLKDSINFKEVNVNKDINYENQEEKNDQMPNEQKITEN